MTYTESDHPALYYQWMLADSERMRVYRQAIEAAVRPGDVVADLGTGTGVLALTAARAGAKRVYAVENRPQVIPIVRRIVQANGAESAVTVVEADAREAQLDEPVDVIVNELIGDFGTDEAIFECVAGFARRNLKPGGRVVPDRLQTYLVPVEYGDEFRGVYREDFHGMDLRAALDDPFQPGAVMYGLRARPKELAQPALIEDIRFGRDMGERSMPFERRFEIHSRGVLQGFVGYFRANLGAGLSLSNYPCYPGCHWENWHWPVTPPVSVAPGQGIRATLLARKDMIAAGWAMEWSVV